MRPTLQTAVDGASIPAVQLLIYGFKRLDVPAQQYLDILRIGHADLLPHDRGGGGDPGNVFKASGGDGPHELLLIVIIPYKIHQTGGHQMGQMADGGHRKIVLPVIGDHGNGSNGQGHPPDPSDLLRGALFCGRDHIVCVFQEMVCGVLVAGLF